MAPPKVNVTLTLKRQDGKDTRFAMEQIMRQMKTLYRDRWNDLGLEPTLENIKKFRDSLQYNTMLIQALAMMGINDRVLATVYRVINTNFTTRLNIDELFQPHEAIMAPGRSGGAGSGDTNRAVVAANYPPFRQVVNAALATINYYVNQGNNPRTREKTSYDDIKGTIPKLVPPPVEEPRAEEPPVEAQKDIIEAVTRLQDFEYNEDALESSDLDQSDEDKAQEEANIQALLAELEQPVASTTIGTGDGDIGDGAAVGAENDGNDSLEDEQAEKADELAINVRPISNDAFNTGGIVLGADLVDVFDDVPRGVQVDAEGRQQQRQSVLQMERNDVILAANDDNAAITRPPTRSAIRSAFRTAFAADLIRRGVLKGAYEGQYVNLTTVPRNSLIMVPETAINTDNTRVFLTPWEYEMLFNDQTGAFPSINAADYLTPVTIAQLEENTVRYTARNLLELGILYVADTDLEREPANAVFDITRTDILSFLEQYQQALETNRERPKRAENRPSILNTVSAVLRGEEPLFVLPTTGGLDGDPFPVFLPRDLDQQVRDAFIGQTNRDGEELLDDGPGDDDPTASLTNPHREPEVIGPDIFDAVMDEDNPFLNVVLSSTAAVGAIAVQYAFDAPKRAVDVQPSGFGGGGGDDDGDDGDFDPKKVGSSGFRRPVDKPVPKKPSTPPEEGLNNAQKLALGGAAMGAGAVAGSKLLIFAKTIGSILILPATVAAGAYVVSYAARQARNEAE